MCSTTVAEVPKQLRLEGNKLEHPSASNSIKHDVPLLKKDDLNEYLAWSDAIYGLILATECSMTIDEKKMHVLSRFVLKED